ncbi:MAG: hypothetical protein L0211_25655 [Planctomycetaceae bacterium]|nr:hypothetical protein [Planctomycetaceae bacterium]
MAPRSQFGNQSLQLLYALLQSNGERPWIEGMDKVRVRELVRLNVQVVSCRRRWSVFQQNLLIGAVRLIEAECGQYAEERA